MCDSVDRFICLGMCPIRGDSTGNYTVDWRSLKSMCNYEMQWHGMVSGNDNDLHTPPLILPQAVSSHVAIMWMDRFGNNLVLCGGFHRNVPRNANPVTIKLKFTLDICNSNKKMKSYKIYEGIFTLDRDWKKTLTEFSDLPWPNISASIAPIAHIAISKP